MPGVRMKLVGHKTESIYRRFAITKEPDLTEGVAKLGALETLDFWHSDNRDPAARGPDWSGPDHNRSIPTDWAEQADGRRGSCYDGDTGGGGQHLGW